MRHLALSSLAPAELVLDKGLEHVDRVSRHAIEQSASAAPRTRSLGVALAAAWS